VIKGILKGGRTVSQDKNDTYQRLGELWVDPKILTLEMNGNKFFVFSDVHLGNGKGADDFKANEETLLAALDSYKERGYKLILLGDIEEFWQFTLAEIDGRYDNTVYEKIRSFDDSNVLRVYGNHDIDWYQFKDPTKNNPPGEACAVEALKMKLDGSEIKMLFVHGHQGSKLSDKKSWSSRFFVRLYREVEPFVKKIGFNRNPSATKSRVAKDYEKIVYSWAKKNRAIVVCGHTHRAIFSSKSYAEKLQDCIADLQREILENRTNKNLIDRNRKTIKEKKKEYIKEKKRNLLIESTESDGQPIPCYFNTGCALYEDGITGIEISDDKIKLVKWNRDPKIHPRDESYGEVEWEQLFQNFNRGA